MNDRDVRWSGLLFVLTFLGSAVSWWPFLALDLSFWIPLGCAAFCMCLSIALLPSMWPLLLLAAGLGTFGGIAFSAAMWPPYDPYAGFHLLFLAAGSASVLLVAALLASLIILVASVFIRTQSISTTRRRRTIWVVLIGWVAFGLVSLALAPTLIRHRMDRNDGLAAARFTSLKDAYERAVKAYRVSHISDGMALKPHYFGLPFTNMNWKRSVEQDGYRFTIDGARSGGGYTIWAVPLREHLDGARRFCTDESGKIGCRVEPYDSRYRCLPCSK